MIIDDQFSQQRATREARRAENRELARAIAATGGSRKSLAHRLNQLAKAAGLNTCYTHTSWANWTSRGIRPSQRVRPLIAQVLSERLGRPVSLQEIGLDNGDSPDASVGLDFHRDLPTAVQIATRLWSQADRHAVLDGAGFTAGGYDPPLRRWLTTPADTIAASQPASAFRQVGQADVAELLAVANDARRADSRYGGGNWRAQQIQACLKERAAPLLLGSYTDATGRQLFAATAQLSRLAGWTAFDNGEHARAQRHYIQALRLARAAGDIAFGGYILTCMALQTTVHGFHEDALDMVDGAFHRARTHAPPRVLAFYKVTEARVHARNGDARAADVALAAAEHLLDASTPIGDDPEWIDFFNHHRLAADAVEIQRDLGRPDHALRWNIHAAVPAAACARSFSIWQAVLGSTHLRGYHLDLELALAHGHRAIAALADVRSARAADYLNQFVSTLSRWKSEPGVRDLVEQARCELLSA